MRRRAGGCTLDDVLARGPAGRRALLVPLCALAFACAGAQAAADGTLRADYELMNTRASSCCGAPPLTDIGPGANAFASDSVGGATRPVLAFPLSNGMSAATSGVIPSGSYSVVALFRLDETSGYRRILDLAGATQDTGLYVLSDQLSFYPITTSSGDPAPFAAGRYSQVVLTRDGATRQVVGYVDGEQVISFIDSSDQAIIGTQNSLRLFKDDSAVGGEESAGAVARVQLYDGALTAAEVRALGARTLADLPPPVLGEEVNVQATSGEVLVAIPGSATAGRGSARAAQKGLTFVPLSQARQIPTGSFLDTRRGTVALRTARNRKGRIQSGRFAAGLFQVLQSRKRAAKGLTDLRLKGSAARLKSCRSGNRSAGAARLSRRAIRRLRARARGRYRTRGRRSAATVRGTVWTTTDSCAGTLTKVKRGKVAVRDFRRKKTIVVTAGKSYLARAPE